MEGHPWLIDGVQYQPVEEPNGGPVAVRGEHGTVYRLRGQPGDLALKVPDPNRADPGLPQRLSALVEIPGLAAARARPLPPAGPGAFVMPWVEGPTWAEVVAARRPLDLEECWLLGRGLVRTLTELEGKGLVHGRLCGRHILLPGLVRADAPWPTELVDLEHLAGPEPLGRAEPGTAGQHVFNGPRLAGALLLAEILGWWDPEVREAAWGEEYFAPDGSSASYRARLLARALRERWGAGVAELFERSRSARSDGERPTFREWARAVPPAIGAWKDTGKADPILGLLLVAGRLEGNGFVAGSLVRYRQLAGLLPAETRLGEAVWARIRRLEGRIAWSTDWPHPSNWSSGNGRRDCLRCGAQLKPGARFCSRCGAGVGGR